MLMYVVRSMNLWASTDMRLTISPTVEDFLAELVITRACGTKERERVSVADGEPALYLQALEREGGCSRVERPLLFPPPLLTYLPSQLVRLSRKPPLVWMHSLPPHLEAVEGNSEVA